MIVQPSQEGAALIEQHPRLSYGYVPTTTS